MYIELNRIAGTGGPRALNCCASRCVGLLVQAAKKLKEMRNFTFSLLVLASVMVQHTAFSQTVPTWAEDVAPIVYKHCTSCHRRGEIGPFPLTSYQEAIGWGQMIKYVTGIRYMPPWKPDEKFGAEYIGENYLSDQQVATIKAWVDGGMPRGNIAVEPLAPVFPEGSQIGKPDLVLSFAKKHIHIGDNKDAYRYFVIPTGLKEPRDLVSLEMRPSNRKIVHHALIWADTTGIAAVLDALTPDYGYAPPGNLINLAQVSLASLQLPGYAPGARPHVFSNGMAVRLPPNSDLVVQVHYAPTTTDEPDSSSFNLFFADKPAKRYVNAFAMLTGTLRNGPFVINPNTVKEFHGVYKTPIDISLVGIAPHSHLLGKNWRVFAITPARDTIPLVHVRDWDFNWQGAYYFKKMKYLPKNSEIHAYATYDNTTNNPLNPNNPPKKVTWGEATTDEMYFLPIAFVPYEPGDENLNMDSLATNATEVFHFSEDKLYPVAPNPVRGLVRIGFTLANAADVTLEIYDLQGRLIETLIPGQRVMPGQHTLGWDSSALPAGMYQAALRVKGKLQTQKIVVP
jgi:hypothetical protein